MTIELQKRILSSLILITLSFFFIIKGSFLFNFFLFVGLCITIYEWHLMSKKKNYHLIGIIFLCFSFYLTYSLRSYPDDKSLLFFFTLVQKF